MVGSALSRRLEREHCILITAPHSALDLTRQSDVEAWMDEWRPEAVFLAAAKVGGIVANSTSPVDFLEDNLSIATNVIHAAARAWRRETSLPWLLLHLPEIRRTADQGRSALKRSA